MYTTDKRSNTNLHTVYSVSAGFINVDSLGFLNKERKFKEYMEL